MCRYLAVMSSLMLPLSAIDRHAITYLPYSSTREDKWAMNSYQPLNSFRKDGLNLGLCRSVMLSCLLTCMGKRRRHRDLTSLLCHPFYRVSLGMPRAGLVIAPVSATPRCRKLADPAANHIQETGASNFCPLEERK